MPCGAPGTLAAARVQVWRCEAEGRPSLPHHFVCVEKFTLVIEHLSFERR